MILVDKNVLIKIKKFFIRFVIFTINYLKYSIVNFQNLVNLQFYWQKSKSKKHNYESIAAIYE